MFKSARFLWRNNWQNVGVMGLFVGICCVMVLVLDSTQNIFGTYTGVCSLMLGIIVLVAGVNFTVMLVNLGLSMGATRKGMWGAVQLNLAAATALCVVLQLFADAICNKYESRILMNLSIKGITGLLFVLLMLFLGNIGALVGLMHSVWGRVIGIVVGVLVMIGVFVGGMLQNFSDSATEGFTFKILAICCAVCGVGTVVCAVLSWVRLRSIQVKTI